MKRLKKIFLFILLLNASWSAYSQVNVIAQADSLFLMAEYDAAIDLLKKVDSVTNSLPSYLYSRYMHAECLSRKGLYDDALELITKSWTSKKGDSLDALFYNSKGYVFLHKGRSDLALENFLKGLEIYQQNGNLPAKSFARCLSNLGLAYWTMGNQSLAKEYLEQALNLRKNFLPGNLSEIAASLNNLGLIYASEDPSHAADYYTQSLEIYKVIFKPDHPALALAYNNLGIADRNRKKYDLAIFNFEQALEIQRGNFGEPHAAVAFVYNNIAQTYFEKGEDLPALTYFNLALDNYRKHYGDKHPEVAYIYNMLASIFRKESKYDECLEMLQQALCSNSISFNDKSIYSFPKYNDYYNATLLLATLQLKAQALEERHYNKTLKHRDLFYAMSSLEICDSLIEKIRQTLINKNDKIALGKTSSDIYEHAVKLSYALSEVTARNGYYRKRCFYFSEKNKSAVLLEAISDANAKSFANIPDELLEKEKSFKADITFCEQKLAAGGDAETEKIYRDKLFRLNEEYRNFTTSLEKQFPQYFNLKYNIRMAQVDEVQGKLKKEECLISYFISEHNSRLFIFQITAKTYKAYSLPLDPSFDKMITAFRNSIRFKVSGAFLESSGNLYRQLFPFNIPAGVNHLIIIPDGRLGVIPFEALVKSDKNNLKKDFNTYSYMIGKFAFSYNYSVTLYWQMQSENATGTFASRSVFLCAPVSFDPSTRLNKLPGTEQEVEQISALFKDRQCNAGIYKWEQANEYLVKSDLLSKYRYLHLATHGIVDEERPELSEIFLCPDTVNGEDGNLYAGEIYNLNIGADLVTLSACQTGLGKISKGEGIIGLSRALIYAGANNVLVSLWSVNDASTARLMISFYEDVLNSTDHENYSQALQKAKLKLIRESEFFSPYYWAPFILIGR